MARYKEGMLGRISGKVGTVVGASCRGIPYIRGVSSRKTKASTAQINQRLKFAMMINWLMPLLRLINEGFEQLEGGKTAMNVAMSIQMRETVVVKDSEFVIDFSRAIFSRGSLVNSFVDKIEGVERVTIGVSWKNAAPSVYNKDSDQVNFIIYNEQKEQFVTYERVVERGAGYVLLRLPKHFPGDVLHLYMNVFSAEGKRASTSVYLGAREL